MRPASRQRTDSGTSRPNIPTIIQPEELEMLFGRTVFTQEDRESLLFRSHDIREGEIPQSLYFPRPQLTVADLADTFRFPNPVPNVIVPAEWLKEPWATEIQEVGWCRIDLLKKESAEVDVSERGAAELQQKGYRLPNAFEMLLASVILHRRKHPLTQSVLSVVTSDQIIDYHHGNRFHLSMVVKMHNNQVYMRPATDAVLKSYSTFHMKIG